MVVAAQTVIVILLVFFPNSFILIVKLSARYIQTLVHILVFL